MLQNMKEQLVYGPQPPLQQQQQDDGDFRKCGGIFVSSADDMTFGLNCSFCSVVCLQFDTFMQHMRDQHLQDLQRDSGDQDQTQAPQGTIFEAAVEAEPLECRDNEIACDFDWTEITSMLNGDDGAIMTFDSALLEGGDNEALATTVTETISPNAEETREAVVMQAPEQEVDLIYILEEDEQVIGGSALTTGIVMQQEETVDTYELFTGKGQSEWSTTLLNGGEAALTFASSPLTCTRPEPERAQDRDEDESEASLGETMKCDLSRMAADDDDELTYTSQKSTDDSLPLESAPTPAATKSREPKEKYTKTPAMRAATKNKELIAYLIEAYRAHEKLWNPNHPEYKYNANRQMYNELAGPLQRDMQCSLSGIEIFGIITELRGRYRRELTKAKDRKGSTFKTKLWYFDKLEFLRNLIEDKRAVRKAKTMESDTTECKQSEHRELQSYLLDAYKRREVLWNPKHPEFQHCNTQHQFDDIALSLQEDMNVVLSGSQCHNEIKRLRTCFRKELGFQAKRKGYVPKLWCFEQMAFLRPLWDEEISKRKNKINSNSETKSRLKFLRADPIPLLGNEQSARFIEIYKGCPSLWDVEHPDYRSTTYRSKTLSQMLEQVNCEFRAAYSVEQLEKTLHQLRKEYSAEKEKRLGGRVDATHMAAEVYENLKPILEENLGPFRCELCQILLKTSDQYKIHRSGHDGSKPFTCSLCGKGFQIPGNLTIHIRRHKRDYPYACELCDKRFPTTSELTIHIRSHTGERPYICDLCGKSFKTWSFFDIHRRAHLNQSPFHCPICDKGFYERNRFTDHMNIHLNIRKHNCTECGKAFTTYANLRKHQELHLPVKKYTCTDCKRGFSQFASLRWHMRTTHKDSRVPSAKRRSEDEADRSDAMEY